MLPINSSSNYLPVQTPFAHTAILGSSAAHVPYDNVAPSVSNAQINNNAKANSDARAAAAQEPAAVTAGAPAEIAVAGAASQGQAVSVQAAYLTQLLAQDASPESGAILVQYEKLVALGNVKYKPSNALKPVEEPVPQPVENPSASFGRIVRHEAASAPVQTVAEPVVLEVTNDSAAQAAPVVDAPKPQDTASYAPAVPQGATAYSASAARPGLVAATTAELA